MIFRKLCITFGFLAIGILLSCKEGRTSTTASPQVSTFIIDCPQLNTERKVWLYLPKSYHTSNKRYPVVYMTDGQNLFDAYTSYAGEWKVDETLDSLKTDVIVVGIEHGGDKRMQELTPWPSRDRGGGKGDLFLDFIVNSLKPTIDQRYRTHSNAEHTTIMGSSLGGLFAFYALFERPDIFSSAGVFSPSFRFTQDIFIKILSMEELPSVDLFMVTGAKEGDMTKDHARMTRIINQRKTGATQFYQLIVPQGTHSEAFWGTMFPEVLQWILQRQWDDP